MPDRSLTENVAVIGAVVVVIVAFAWCGADALNPNAITAATTSKPPLIFLILFILIFPSYRELRWQRPLVAALTEPLPSN